MPRPVSPEIAWISIRLSESHRSAVADALESRGVRPGPPHLETRAAERLTRIRLATAEAHAERAIQRRPRRRSSRRLDDDVESHLAPGVGRDRVTEIEAQRTAEHREAHARTRERLAREEVAPGARPGPHR